MKSRIPTDNTSYESLYALGDWVKLTKELGKVTGDIVGIRFTEYKVTYDIVLDTGGETLRDVDSAFIKGEVV
jgi:hypothetical protein